MERGGGVTFEGNSHNLGGSTSQGHSQHIVLVAARDQYWERTRGPLTSRSQATYVQLSHGLQALLLTLWTPLFQILYNPPWCSVVTCATAACTCFGRPSPVSGQDGGHGSFQLGTTPSSSQERRGMGSHRCLGRPSLLLATHSPTEWRVISAGPRMALCLPYTSPQTYWACHLAPLLWPRKDEEQHPAFPVKTASCLSS